MGRILTEENLTAYITWRGKPWGVADLLYERVPMLTIRNYISEENGQEWPLCWSSGRALGRGLALCIDFLRDWKAFRPCAARSYRKAMEQVVPGVVMQFQTLASAGLQVHGIREGGRHKQADTLVRAMTRAVAEVSALKRLSNPTPMLGSKVMHFFFPEFFPVWDTAMVKKALNGLRRVEGVGVSEGAQTRVKGPVEREYGAYVRLMLEDLCEGRGEIHRLNELLLDHAVGEYQDKFLRDLLDENLGDRSPILFELCTLGYARRRGLL